MGIIHPIDFHIFSRWLKPPTSINSIIAIIYYYIIIIVMENPPIFNG